jgi:D-3-phosphoglycerate dehydrogenase
VEDVGEKYQVVLARFLEKTPDLEEEIFQGVATVDAYNCQNEDEVAEVVADADAVITGPVEVREKAIARMTKCKIISTLGVGFDRVNLEVAGEKGIYVCNVPDYCVNEVADHTIGLLLAINRKLVTLNNAAKKGLWFSLLPTDISTPVMRLKEKTLGIIGLGRIGTAVAIRAKALGLRVLFYDPYVKRGIEDSLKLDRLDSLETLLENSDVVSIHTPLTDETFHMIQEEQFKRMKKTAFIINTARGKIIDKNALLKALEEQWIEGAALDVLEQEPPTPSDPLLSFDNVLITPHRAFYSEDSIVDVRRKASINVLRVLQGKKPFYIVNEEFLRS